ncbi:LOW QUALITY PROTEIN: hypothetical protein TorRG33x02_024780 [Trema orientale]|uniref:Uncharacterized protein n=1 Tax=Trema orientale TaxID=63057 RepID=A0A2P5FV79_TREOI|nr:LOW QUALITY PROTEIN: hypothetical protein TorRG33x02_024780 [Trema orientale]
MVSNERACGSRVGEVSWQSLLLTQLSA